MNSTCTPNFNYFDSPQFLSIGMHIASVVVTPFHLLGLYCIIYKTPLQMKAVKWYLLNMHCSVMFFDYSVTVLGIPFVLATKLAGFSLGLLQYSNYSFLLSVAVMALSCQFLTISIAGIFENRFNTFCNFFWVPFWKKFISPLFLPYQYIVYPSLLTSALLFIPDQKTALQAMFKTLPCLPREIYEADIYVIVEDMALHAVMISFGVSGVLIQVVFFVGSLLYSSLEQLRARTMSQKTFQMQKQFLIAVILQSSVPLVCFAIPIIYFLIAYLKNYYSQGIINCLFINTSTHGLISAIALLTLHKPYRAAVLVMIAKTPELRIRSKVSQLSNLSRSGVVIL